MAWANWLQAVRGGRAGPRRASYRRVPQQGEIESLEIRTLLAATGGTGIFVNSGDQTLGGLFGIALGDLDGDGDVDGVGTNGGLVLFKNDALGGFTRRQIGSEDVRNLDLGDVDGDGDLDVFVACISNMGDQGRPNQVWLNDGLGNFSDSGQRLGNSRSTSVKLDDLDGDGDLDAFVGDIVADQVWLNNGLGQFADSGQRLGGGTTFDVSLGDMDGDGDVDAFLATSADKWNQWKNTGNGTFVVGNLRLGNLNGVALDDLDSDGDLDAVVTQANGINWLRNLGAGGGGWTYGPLAGSRTAADVALGDLNGDGAGDVFAAAQDSSLNQVFLADISGGFVATGQTLDYDGTPVIHNRTVLLEDLDGDNDLDAIVVNTARSIVFLNEGSEGPEISLPSGGVYELLVSGDDLLVQDQAGIELHRRSLNSTRPIVIQGSEGNDTLRVNLTDGNPIGAGGLRFNAQGGSDSLVLIGGSATTDSLQFQSDGQGWVNFDDSVIRLTGVETISDQFTVANRSIEFGDGNDRLTLSDNGSPNDGLNRLTLEAGVSIEFATPSASLVVRAGAGNDTVTLADADESLTSAIQVFGESGIDILTGRMSADLLDGGGGNDVLNGRGGDDTLIGGSGLDSLFGGRGHDSLDGGADNDKLDGHSGKDTLDGGTGNDQLDGRAGRDDLRGGIDNDTLGGQAGNDLLDGGTGHDQLNGHAGNDLLQGREGHDTLNGAAGIDSLFGDAGLDFLIGGAGSDQLDGGADSDRMQGDEGNDWLNGSTGNDFLKGDTGRDTLFGGDGHDRLLGGGNIDDLRGGAGRDSLEGGLGADTLDGGDASGDTIIGLPSEYNEPPTEVFLSIDSVAEFSPLGTFVGQLSAIDPDGDTQFTYQLISGAADNTKFTLSGDQVRTNTALDFNTQDTYRIRVRATDAKGLFCEQLLSILIQDN